MGGPVVTVLSRVIWAGRKVVIVTVWPIVRVTWCLGPGGWTVAQVNVQLVGVTRTTVVSPMVGAGP